MFLVTQADFVLVSRRANLTTFIKLSLEISILLFMKYIKAAILIISLEYLEIYIKKDNFYLKLNKLFKNWQKKFVLYYDNI